MGQECGWFCILLIFFTWGWKKPVVALAERGNRHRVVNKVKESGSSMHDRLMGETCEMEDE